MKPGQIAAVVLAGVGLIVALSLAGNMVESVDQNEIMVIQAPLSGQLAWYTNGGTHAQMFGTITKYPKRGVYEIEQQVRFNDGGHGVLKGSVQYELPLDPQSLTAIHTRFQGPEAVKTQLIQTVVAKAVYMTGPLMSSKESYAEKRNDLISYVEDQIQNGVYRTRQREVRVTDPLTNQEKSAVVTEIVQRDGAPVRQEDSVLSAFHVKTYNFSVKQLEYDKQVEEQIQQQQQITMQVQTAIAESRQAEQRAITVEQQGKASAAEAKWKQEVEKAQQVTAAQQRLEVATIANKEADQYREAALKKADADATYRKRMMDADGALEKRLQAQIEIARLNADAIKNIKVPIVPATVFGAGGNQSSVTTLLDLLNADAAKRLSKPE